MTWSLLALAAVAALLALLTLKLRGAGPRGDPTAPRKPKPRRLSHKELDDLTTLVGRGGEAEVRRRLKSAGYDEAAADRLLWFMVRIGEPDSSAAQP